MSFSILKPHVTVVLSYVSYTVCLNTDRVNSGKETLCLSNRPQSPQLQQIHSAFS